jgi:universal stress protein F
MYNNILVAIALDQTHDTADALAIARTLTAEGASITALNVVEDVAAYAAAYLPKEHYETRRADAEAELQAQLGSATDIKPVVASGAAGTRIVEYAIEHDMDCIVIASHRPGLQDYFLGSTAGRVVRHAPCAVHVLR